MDDYSKTVTCRFSEVLKKYDITYLRSKLLPVDRIDAIDIKPESIIIEYVTLNLSRNY